MSETNAVPHRGNIAYDASAALALTNAAQHTLANAKTFGVDSPEMLEAADEDLRSVKALQKRVEDQRTAITVPLNAALKAVNDLFRPAAEFLKEAESTLKGAMLTYTAEQERLAAIAKRQADEAARIERERLEVERRAQEEAARKAREAAQEAARAAAAAQAAGDLEAAAQAEQEARAQADAAQAAEAQAQATAVTAAVISMPVAVAAPTKAKGTSIRVSVDFEVTDKLALIQHIAANPDLADLLMVDSVKLRAQVRVTGLNTKLPGVAVFPKRTMAARAA